MSATAPQNGAFVGLDPWLPWPLSGWRWWTVPVPGQRLASLRIGLATVLLLDMLLSYGPRLTDLFGPGSLGSSELFSWYSELPRWRWSLFRGFDHPFLSSFALISWFATTLMLFFCRNSLRTIWIVWLISGAVFQFGLWSREIAAEKTTNLGLLAPLIPWIVASVFLTLALRKINSPVWIIAGWVLTTIIMAIDLAWFDQDIPWIRGNAETGLTIDYAWLVPLVPWILGNMFLILELKKKNVAIGWITFGWALTTILLAIGIWLVPLAKHGNASYFRTFLQTPWDASPMVLRAGFAVWLVSVILLLVGFCTRTSAVVAWVLSTSFANLNPNIDNAGDTVRGIIMFYLMLCPCGAAWSIDGLLARRRGRTGPVFVSPWALRLLFVQMTLIYFMNGIYKLTGTEWRDGTSLYYVWCDLTLSRFSYAQIALPLWLVQILSWGVMVWEVGFPVWVAIPWTRTAALLMGVAFHLGIMLTMELGFFGPYMLTLYLPLVPWERFTRQTSNVKSQMFNGNP